MHGQERPFQPGLSDHGALMDKFLGLPKPHTFMHGQQNAWQSHLPRLRAHGIHGEGVPDCGHFPMDVKPVHTWRAIAGFHADSGKAS